MTSDPHRRLAGALIISVTAHLLIISPLRLPSGKSVEVVQPVLRASLTRPPPVTPKPEKAPEAAPQAKKSPPQKKEKKRLTSTKGSGRPVTAPAAPTPPPAEEAAVTEPPVEAVVLDEPAPPEYPTEALEQGLEGCVLARILVNEIGEPEDVTILATDHPGVFDQSVINSQKTARYAPARRGNAAVRSDALAVATFVLKADHQLGCPLKFAPLAEQYLAGKGAP